MRSYPIRAPGTKKSIWETARELIRSIVDSFSIDVTFKGILWLKRKFFAYKKIPLLVVFFIYIIILLILRSQASDIARQETSFFNILDFQDLHHDSGWANAGATMIRATVTEKVQIIF